MTDLLDLLVVGGLTIDRFADDRLVPGGSVLHATRAAADAGLVTAAITVAGDEPTAREGIEELRRRTAEVELRPAAETIRFRHREAATGRRLWLECSGGSIQPGSDAGGPPRARAVLYAPVAAEIGVTVLGSVLGAGRRRPVLGAILQGWLRRANRDREILPIAPAALADDLVAALARFDLLVASREDLLAVEGRPERQLLALRSRVGDGPILVVTDGPEGVWLGDGASAPHHLPAPWRVGGVPMVGAGDAFAALFVAGLARQPARSSDDLEALAVDAMRGVAEMLEARRGEGST